MFNACVESRKYCSHILACIDHSNRNVFTTVLYINIYIYTISHGHISPVSYHIVRVSHFQANVHTGITRRIHPMFTMWYNFPIAEKCAYGNI